MCTEQQKKEIKEAMNMIHFTLEVLNKAGKIGSHGYGTRSYEQGLWDPKRKKNFIDYMKAIFKIKAMGSNHPFRFGFKHLCTVNNPQNTHRVILLDKEYPSQSIFIHWTDIINYDDFMRELDALHKILVQLDLRKFPGNNQKLKMVN